MAQSDPLAASDHSHHQAPCAFMCCTVRIDAVTIEDAVDRLLTGQARGAVHLCNAYTLSLASRDASLASQLNRGSLNLADGKPLVWIARHLGFKHLKRRVYGPELMERTIEGGQADGICHFLYGSTPEVIEGLTLEVSDRCPKALLVGAESPPFGALSDTELDAAARRFEAAGAQIVWVGLGTPKQDVVVAQLAAKSDLTFVAIGAAFDFIAGAKKQAPRFMQERGLEWLFRLVSEPRRLWKRYLVGNARFVWVIIRTRPSLAE